MASKKFEGILICSDIDGTLFYQHPGQEKGYVPENSCRAVKYFQDNGGRFTLATGRFPGYAERNLMQYFKPNAPTVTLNGAVIYDFDRDGIIDRRPICDDIARLAYDVIESYPEMIRTDLQCEGGISYTVKRGSDGGFVCKNSGRPEDGLLSVTSREEFSEMIKDVTVYKVLYVFKAEDSERACAEIAARFPEYAVTRSWKNGVELQRADADKGHSTRRLAELLGDVRLLVCVGDYENDISMLKLADIGYAVGDANERAKAAADRITARSCKEGAIEEIIEQLEKEFGKK